MKRLLFLCLLFMAGDSFAGLPLTAWPSLSPVMQKQISSSGQQVKGSGDNNWYALEIDPTTGTWNTIQPVSGTITANNASVSATGAAVPASATMVGGSDGTNLRAVKVSATGVVSVDGSATTQPVSGTVTANIGTAGTLATAAKQDTGNTSLGSIDGKVPALGQAAMASSVPVAIASNQTGIPVTGTFWQATQPVSGTFWQATQPVSGTFWQATQPVSGTVTANAGSGTFTTSGTVTNLPTTVDTNQGTAGASTIRTTTAGADVTKNVVASNNYASTAVTTAAYVQLIASTANAVNTVCLSNSSGSIIIMATGGAGVEADRIYVPAGGSGCWQDTVAASTRISMKALDATASVGYFLLTATQ